MAFDRTALVLEHLRRLAAQGRAVRDTDGELLERFRARGDEAAFEALLARHGPMVWRLCRRLLPDWHDAEDVFQATFLVLAHKAGSVRNRDSVGSWLYGVAGRLAGKLRRRARPAFLAQDLSAPTLPEPAALLAQQELKAALDQALDELAEQYRTPLLLHYVEGQTQEEIAAQLGCSLSTVKRRLERGRTLLRSRLKRRGLTLGVPLLAATLAAGQLSAGVPAGLVPTTLRAARGVQLGHGAIASLVSRRVIILSEGVLRAMLWNNLRCMGLVLLLAVLGAGGLWSVRSAPAGPEPIEQPDQAKEPAAMNKIPPPTVYALLHVPREALQAQKGGDTPPGDAEFAQFRGTQAALLRSRLVLNAALRNKEVSALAVVREQANPVAWLEKQLRIDFPEQGEVIRVGMDGSRSEQLAVVVNGVVDAYIQGIPAALARPQNERIRKMEEMRVEYEKKLRDQRQTLHDLQLHEALDQPLLLQALNDCSRELRRIRLERAAVEARLNLLRAGPVSRSEAATQRMRDLEEQAAVLAAQEKVLQEENKQTREQYADLYRRQNSSDLLGLREEIREAENSRKQISARIDAYRSRTIQRPGIEVLQRAHASQAQ
jgi:RNA polymerase sigma factor (sigma-70 family)